MTMWQFYKELWTLLRGIPDNPLIWSSEPWRRGKALSIAFLLQVSVAVVFPIAMSFLARFTKHGDWGDVAFYVTFMLGIVLGVPLLVPVNIIMFGPPQTRDRKRLEEIAVTPISSTEAAFADVYWGIVTSAVVAIGLVVTMLLNPPSFGNISFYYTLPVVALETFLCNCIIAVSWRFRLRINLWRMLLVCPATAVLFGSWYVGFLLIVNVLTAGNAHIGVWLFFSATLIGALGLWFVGPIGGKLAGTRLFADLAPEDLLARSSSGSARELEREGKWAAILSSETEKRLGVSAGWQIAAAVGLVTYFVLISFPLERQPTDAARLTSMVLFPALHFILSTVFACQLFGREMPRHLRKGATWRTLQLTNVSFSKALGILLLLSAMSGSILFLLQVKRTLMLDTVHNFLGFIEAAFAILIALIPCQLIVTPAWLAFCLSRPRPFDSLIVFTVGLAVVAVIGATFYQAEGLSNWLLVPQAFLGLFTPIPLLYCFQQLHEKYFTGVAVGSLAKMESSTSED